MQKQPHPDLPPPVTSVGILGWLRKNLFSSAFNSVLTLVAIYLIYITLVPAFQWAFLNADWVGDSREACDSGGACWVFVGVRFFSLFPKAQPPRIGPAKPPPAPVILTMLYALWIGFTVVFAAILAGGLF